MSVNQGNDISPDAAPPQFGRDTPGDLGRLWLGRVCQPDCRRRSTEVVDQFVNRGQRGPYRAVPIQMISDRLSDGSLHLLGWQIGEARARRRHHVEAA